MSGKKIARRSSALSLFDVGIIYEYYGRLSKRDDSSQSITDFKK